MSNFNKVILRRIVEDGFNKHDNAMIAEIYPNCVYHSPTTGELRGEAYRMYVASVFAAFPDGKWTIEDQLAEGDKVMTRWSFTGTHKGMFKGIAPTGRKVVMTGMVIDRVVEGRIVEEWEEFDALGTMRQLGVMPEVTVGGLVAA